MVSTSKLGAFANLALVARAVLIPPTISAEELGDDSAMEGLVIDPFRRSYALACPGCAVATVEKDSLNWERNAGNAFLLNFEVGPRQDSLEIDGYQLFPPSLSSTLEPFSVTQIDPKAEESLRLRVTGYELRYNGAETVSEAGTELLPMTFQIKSIEGTPVEPPALTINVLKDSEGRLMIASFETAQPAENTSIAAEKDCNEWPLLCKWKGIMADRIEKMKKMGKGCHNRPHGHDHVNPMKEETFVGKPPHRFRPGRPDRPGHSGRPGHPDHPHDHPHHRPHHMGHGGHHHSHHRVQMFLRRAFFTILIPIIIGVFAGTVTYLIGMFMGCLIAMTIAKVRGQRYQRIALEDDLETPEEPEVPSEKEECAELPEYDAPPVYEEAAEKEVDVSK